MFDESNELAKLEWNYTRDPDNIELASRYAKCLSSAMDNSSFIPTKKALLELLTEVYQKHCNNEGIAVCYLSGISHIPEYVDNAANKMMEVVNRFPNSYMVKWGCAYGLSRLVSAYVHMRDLSSAEQFVKYLEKMYSCYPTNDQVGNAYASALFYVWNIQGFFGKRDTVAKLKKLAAQYPNNEQIVRNYKFASGQ